MARIVLVMLGSMVAAGCAADAPSGLWISAGDPGVVAGRFVQESDELQFTFSHQLAKHEAVLASERGEVLEDVFWLDGGIDDTTFVLASLLGGRAWASQVDGASASQESGDPRAVDELAARPEMQLVVPMLDALEETGFITRSEVVDPSRNDFAVDLYLPTGDEWRTVYVVAPREPSQALHHGG